MSKVEKETLHSLLKEWTALRYGEPGKDGSSEASDAWQTVFSVERSIDQVDKPREIFS